MSDKLGILKRLAIVIAAPILVPLCFILLTIYAIALFIGWPIYWILTGKDIMDTNYNIWNI